MPNGLTLPALSADLNTDVPASTNLQVVLLDDSTITKNFTDANVNTTTNRITITSHGFIDGIPVLYTALSGSIGGLTSGSSYYVNRVDANTVELESTFNGGAIDLTSVATGSFTLATFPIVNATSPISNFKSVPSVTGDLGKSIIIQQFEIASYQGLSTRPVVNRGTTPITEDEAASRASILLSTTLNNTGGGAGISFTAVMILSGGSTTRLDTTGTLIRVGRFSGTETVNAGASRVLDLTPSVLNG
jgi:hypothetical protein